ncbi:uncharacterized protein BCR38DRAFT_435379 [Pseudomassariella vexata]|uniref:Uncharacterized protein n=1 Tax=Pseudomassariella vexata TaxID=1141098 RepID=A0A1Y2DUR1_9PEZI|nr:uncharacterized protein BCR38DRAFT_435379 [Pseudomassariella vexata]ORY62884.1 hypothetical protein BCR38DRAFT_435379 [Pseudomassariella vexata]
MACHSQDFLTVPKLQVRAGMTVKEAAANFRPSGFAISWELATTTFVSANWSKSTGCYKCQGFQGFVICSMSLPRGTVALGVGHSFFLHIAHMAWMGFQRQCGKVAATPKISNAPYFILASRLISFSASSTHRTVRALTHSHNCQLATGRYSIVFACHIIIYLGSKNTGFCLFCF